MTNKDYDIEIIRRIAERGLREAQSNNFNPDVWQHLLDEYTRMEEYVKLLEFHNRNTEHLKFIYQDYPAIDVKLKEIRDAVEKSQEPLSKESEKILFDNLWNFYMIQDSSHEE